MAKGKRVSAGELDEGVVERIRASIREPRDDAWYDSLQPMCRCGLRRKPGGLSKHVDDDGQCFVHPGRPPEPYVPGVAE